MQFAGAVRQTTPRTNEPLCDVRFSTFCGRKCPQKDAANDPIGNAERVVAKGVFPIKNV